MCAVVGLIDTQPPRRGTPNLTSSAYRALTALQHRGQDASGMVSFDGDSAQFYTHKRLGTVANIYTKESLAQLKGRALIGHNRYTTAGHNREWDMQPILSGFPIGMALAHNGNTLNIHELREKLRRERNACPLTANDLECLLYFYGSFITEDGPPKGDGITYDLLAQASKKVMNLINGSYALVGLVAGLGLFGLRDPHGIRPLVLGKRDGRYCLASETGGLDFADFQFVRDIQPGELILIDFQGRLHSTVLSKAKRAHCMFEWVYFAGAESFIEGKAVYQGRLELGKRLGRQVVELMNRGEIEPDLVAPVPDTGRTAAMALSEVVSLPYRECLIKNRYVQRSFILNSQRVRDEMVQRKLVPIRSEIEGKKILLVDDSIVRGTTSKRIVKLLKDYGAHRVYVASTCPPIKHSCYYGIDFPSPEELIATGRDTEGGGHDLVPGADRVIYLTIDNLGEALMKEKMCLGCLTGRYPTDVAQGARFTRDRLLERAL